MHKTQYPDLLVTYREGFIMNTGNINPFVADENSSLIQNSMSSTLFFEFVKSINYFPPLNGSNNFRTVDYDAHINTKIDYSFDHVFKSMTLHELNKLHRICELERTQLLIVLAKSSQNHKLAGYLLTGNRSNFPYVEGSTGLSSDSPPFLQPL